MFGRAILINYEMPGSHEHVECTSGRLSFPPYFPGGVAFDSLSRHGFDCVKYQCGLRWSWEGEILGYRLTAGH